MTDFDILLLIPDVLSRIVLAEWLPLRDLVDLDRSYCSTTTTTRAQFHTILASPGTFKQSSPNLTCLIGYLTWLKARSIHMACLQVPKELAVEPSIYGTLCEDLIRSCGPTLQQIDFQSLVTEPRLHYTCVDSILSLCPNLTDLSLPRGCRTSARFLHKLTLTFPRLQELRILGAYEWEGWEQSESVTWTFPALKVLDVSSSLITTEVLMVLVTVAPKLESFCVYNSLASTIVLSSHSQIWHNLHSLEICDDSLTDAMVTAIIIQNPKLTHIHLENGYRPQLLTDVSLLCIAEYCLLLTQFCIRSDDITDQGMCHLVQHCAKLKTLTLDFNKQLTNLTLLSVAKHCKQLHSLSIYECQCITRLGMLVVVAKCKELHTLNRSFGINSAKSQRF